MTELFVLGVVVVAVVFLVKKYKDGSPKGDGDITPTRPGRTERK